MVDVLDNVTSRSIPMNFSNIGTSSGLIALLLCVEEGDLLDFQIGVRLAAFREGGLGLEEFGRGAKIAT